MFKNDICVVGGGGHVGLPLSVAFANEGKNVIIYDINTDVLKSIAKRELPFMEEGMEPILSKVVNNKLKLTSNISDISSSKFVIIVIGTPVDKHLNPSFKTVKTFFDEIINYLRDDQIIILRSTLYPGLTRKLQKIIFSKGLKTRVTFCPERILEGKAMEELYSLPQIVSGFNKEAIETVKMLFENLTNDIVEVEPLEAELAKLFTNTWRYIQFATANQFYMLAQRYDADFYRVHKTMTHNYKRTKGFPKAGFAAGPCLFKDCMQLAAFSNNTFFLGHSAMLVNEGLPNFLVKELEKEYNIDELTCGILGMAFKAESDDIRESLSYKLKKILEIKSDKVLCSDVYVKNTSFVSEKELIDNSDIILIGAPHDKYKQLFFNGKKVVDVWNHIPKENL
ncbi:MAG: nucleotide sugar dehydrogenase [Lentisphaerae bacterium]|nr:nucleotide sugar dehydrogenase [Lentisphaerota bacterium]